MITALLTCLELGFVVSTIMTGTSSGGYLTWLDDTRLNRQLGFLYVALVIWLPLIVYFMYDVVRSSSSYRDS